MFILKLLIGIFSIVLAVKIGVDKSLKYKNVYEFYNSLINLCDKIISDLNYKKSKMSVILSNKFQSKDLNDMLKKLVKEKKLVVPNYLSKEEAFLIEDLFNSLGKVDANSQILAIEAFKTELKKIANEKYEKYKKYNTLFVKLGFISGLLIFIMVI